MGRKLTTLTAQKKSGPERYGPERRGPEAQHTNDTFPGIFLIKLDLQVSLIVRIGFSVRYLSEDFSHLENNFDLSITI